MTKELMPIEPTKPAAPYLGGKSRLAKTIIEKINQVGHKTYVEPFVGMGGIFLRRDLRPRSEVINDFNKELATFYRILQRHYPQFMETLKFQISSRAEFERLRQTDPETLTDLERAGRFLYMQRLAFGGKVTGNFGVSPDRGGRFNITTLGPMLDDIHSRLAGVVIECLPYQDLIKRYDREETLFYLDPPYHGGEKDYGKGMFERADFERLADILANIKGRFILSINDVPGIRHVFGQFEMEEVRLNYSVSQKGATQARELIISKGV
jgi:DNA adenine methylase